MTRILAVLCLILIIHQASAFQKLNWPLLQPFSGWQTQDQEDSESDPFQRVRNKFGRLDIGASLGSGGTAPKEDTFSVSDSYFRSRRVQTSITPRPTPRPPRLTRPPRPTRPPPTMMSTSTFRPMPKMPQMPFCRAIPGTYIWNACWSNFYEQMARYQQQVFDYYQDTHPNSRPPETGATMSDGSESTHWSATSHFSSSFGMSESLIKSDGYEVRSKGLPISMSSSSDKGVRIYFKGTAKGLSIKPDGRKLLINIRERGIPKEITIKLPRGFTSKNLKVFAEGDYIVVKGPLP